MKFILAGMTLNFFFLNFWGLNWILPLAGAVLLILGFRSLWGVSRWFQTGYNLSVIRLLLLLLELVGDWGLLLLLQLANAAVMLSLCFFLWKGLQEVLNRVDPRRDAECGIALVLWCAAMTLINLLGGGWLMVFLILLVCYILILRKIYILYAELKEKGGFE